MENLRLAFILIFIFLINTSYSREISTIAPHDSKNQTHNSMINSSALGVLAPLANSPLVGIVVISGMAILAQNGVIQENSLTSSNKLLANYWIFGIFLSLSLLKYLTDVYHHLGIISKLFEWIEDNASVTALIFVVFLSGLGIIKATTSVEGAYMAGFSEYLQVIMKTSVIVMSFIVIQTVRFFFGILALSIPVPFLAGFFSTFKNLFTTTLLILYAVSPFIAFICSILLFLFCLAIFVKARRSVKYFKSIYIKPLVSKLMKRKYGLVDVKYPPRILRKIKLMFPDIKMLIPAFPLKKINRIKKKSFCFLINSDKVTYLYKPNLIRKPFILILSNPEDHSLSIGYDLMFIKIFDKSQKSKVQLILSNEYFSVYESIVELTGFSNEGEIGIKKAIADTGKLIHRTRESAVDSAKSLINYSKLLLMKKNTPMAREHL